MEKKTALAKIKTAKDKIIEAESSLDKALREIEAAPRADKTKVSDVVKKAFSDLRAARTTLAELEAMVSTDPE